MPGRVTVLTPVDTSPVIELGNSTWRKQILPVGWLNYDDGTQRRRLNFTPTYLRNIVESFKAKAFDAVPLQLANERNEHNNDPERARGQIIGLDSDERGLWATVKTDERGDKLIAGNPNLGVSVRLVEDYARSDGRSETRHPTALQHVLATWAPRVAGMAPWKAAEQAGALACADEGGGHVLDLSDLVFTDTGEATHPATSVPDPASHTSATSGGTDNGKDGHMPELSDQEKAALAALPSLLAKLAGGDGSSAPTAPTTAAPAGPTQQVTEDTEDTTDDDEGDGGGGNEEFTADEIAAMRAARPPVGGTVAPAATAVAASQGEGDGNAVELAALQAQRDADAVELAHVRNELAEARLNREAEELTTKLGLPPAIVNLALPVLRGTGNAVELSYGAPTEPTRAAREESGRVMREVLTAVAKTYGRRVDLSGAIGSSADVDRAAAEATARDEFIAAQRAAGFGM